MAAGTATGWRAVAERALDGGIPVVNPLALALGITAASLATIAALEASGQGFVSIVCIALTAAAAVTAAGVLALGLTARRRHARLLDSALQRLEGGPPVLFETDVDMRIVSSFAPGGGCNGGMAGSPLESVLERVASPSQHAAALVDITRRRPFAVTLTLADPASENRIVHLSAEPRCDANGEFTGYCGKVEDATDYVRTTVESEAVRRHLRDAIDFTGEGLALWDAEGRLILCNHWFSASFGGAVEHVVAGRTVEQILEAAVLWAPDAFEGEDWAVDLLTAHAAADGRPAELRAADGRWLRIVHHRTPAGHVVTAQTDITELKRVQHELEDRVVELENARGRLERQASELAHMTRDIAAAKDAADAANTAKSQFLAMMSHELRTPLNAILGFSELLRSQAFGPIGSPQYVEYASDIYRSGEHLLELINDLLDLTKIESGLAELEEENVDLNELASSALRLVSSHAANRGVTLGNDVPVDLPYLRGDMRKLRQILLNLLSNSVKFTDAGGEVRVNACHAKGGGIVLRVADTGIGIASEDIGRIMEPFVQADNWLGRQYEGTGLGLPLTRQLAELHGATFDLQSTLNVGTSVTIRFPVERVSRCSRESRALGLAS